MIFEYAIDPSVITEGCKRGAICSLLYGEFGIGKPRILSCYPNISYYREQFERAIKKQNDVRRRALNHGNYKNVAKRDEEKKNLEMLFNYIINNAMFKIRNEMALDGSWLINALSSVRCPPFHAVLSMALNTEHETVLDCSDWLKVKRNTLWDIDTSKMVSRKSEKVAETLAPFLRISSEIIFVDQHFNPMTARYRRQLKCFLEQACSARREIPLRKIEIVSGRRECETIIDDWKRELRKIIPSGISISFFQIERIERGEKIHNRYILSNVGGIQAGIGLDSGDENETDDYSILSREQYKDRWKKYYKERNKYFRETEVGQVIGERRTQFDD